MLSLVSCGSASDSSSAGLDRAGDSWSLPQPVLDAPGRLPGEDALPASVRETLDLQRAFFARDFALLDRALMQAHDADLAGKSDNALIERLISNIQDTQLAGVDACAGWLKASPASYSAHLVCGAMWQKGAWQARGTKFAHEVGEARFAMMYERLARAIALLEGALTLTPKPFEALAMLGEAQHLAGNDAQAEAYLARADALRPGSTQVYSTRLHYAQEAWGGSDAKVQALLAQAKAVGVSQDALANWHDLYVARPGKSSVPGAERAYWERVIREHPTRKRLASLRNDFIHLGNWRDALPVASRLIADYPGVGEDYYWRARIHEGAGRIDDARADYTTALLMGHELSLQEVMLAHLRGGLGVTEKSFDTVIQLCRYGAALGIGVGANCVGSLFWESQKEGVPHRTDPAQSLAWHLVGARAGHYNSQHDLGWMLYTGRGQVADATQSKDLGAFWLRRAAEQNHQFAKRKLEEAGIPEQESLPVNFKDKFSFDNMVAVLNAIIRLVY
jgi:tetratricopeptide (TPR) repeat protein